MARISGVQINGDPERRLPNTANLTIEGADSEGLLMLLDQRGRLLLGRFRLHSRRAGTFSRASGYGVLHRAGPSEPPVLVWAIQYRTRKSRPRVGILETAVEKVRGANRGVLVA